MMYRVTILIFSLFIFTSNTILTAGTWNGSTWQGADFSHKNSDKQSYYINGDLTVSGDFTVKNIYVASGASLTCEGNLTVLRDLGVNGALTVTNNLTTSDLETSVVGNLNIDGMFNAPILSVNSGGSVDVNDGVFGTVTVYSGGQIYFGGTVSVEFISMQKSIDNSVSAFQSEGAVTVLGTAELANMISINGDFNVLSKCVVDVDALVSGSGSVVFAEDASFVNYSSAFNIPQTVSRTWSDNAYAFFSVPFNNQTNTFKSRTYRYEESNLYPTYTWGKVDKNTKFDRGTGYITFAAGEHSFTGYTDLNPVSIPLTYTTTNGAPVEDQGANLVGNPYTCPISYSALIAANNSVVDDGIYFWKDGGEDDGAYRAGDYIIKNMLGASGAIGGVDLSEDNIASMQAFFVHAITNGTLQFDQSMILPDADNSNALKSGQSHFSTMRVSLKADGFYNDVLIGFLDQGIPVQGFKSQKVSGNADFSFFIADKQNLAITAVENVPNGNIIIPLGMQTTFGGLFELELSHNDFDIQYDSIALENTTTGEFISLESGFASLTLGKGTSKDWSLILYRASVPDENPGYNASPDEEKQLVATEYYTISGQHVRLRKVQNLRHYVEVRIYSDGSVESFVREE